MIKNCPVCGKAFDVLWPQLWRYRKEFVYFCSWKCLRKDEENEECEQMKITLDMKKKAVEIAAAGGDVKEFLRKNGARNPGQAWGQIKRFVREKDPVAYERLMLGEDPEKVEQTIPISEPKEEPHPPTVKLDGAIRIETPETNKVEVVETPEQAVIKNKVVDIMEELKIRNPLQYEEFTVREVEGLFGRYRRSDIGQETYIDFEPPECIDVISNTLTQWSSFMKELKRAAQVLGVEL